MIAWKSQALKGNEKSDLIHSMDDDVRQAVSHLVKARNEIAQIFANDLFSFVEDECDKCGSTHFNPREFWVANTAASGAWTRINRALAQFSAKHLIVEDFVKFNESDIEDIEDIEFDFGPEEGAVNGNS